MSCLAVPYSVHSGYRNYTLSVDFRLRISSGRATTIAAPYSSCSIYNWCVVCRGGSETTLWISKTRFEYGTQNSPDYGRCIARNAYPNVGITLKWVDGWVCVCGWVLPKLKIRNMLSNIKMTLSLSRSFPLYPSLPLSPLSLSIYIYIYIDLSIYLYIDLSIDLSIYMYMYVYE